VLKATLNVINLTKDTNLYKVFSAVMGVLMAHNNADRAKVREVTKHLRDKGKGKQKGFKGWGSTPALEKLHNLSAWL